VPTVRRALFVTAALAFISVAGASAQPAAPTVVSVELSDYKFTPKVVELTQGQTYRLHLTNSSNMLHGFEARSFFDTVTLAAWSAGSVQKGGIAVWPGRTVDVDLTPKTPGDYEMHSPYPMNEMLGMKGQIVVH
jgi:uncharacterized cupredoxin-like copper-binding protein